MSEETFSTNIGGCNPSDCAGLRQLPLHKTSCKIAGSRLNSGFFIAKACQFFEKYLLYVLCGVVLYGIILV